MARRAGPHYKGNTDVRVNKKNIPAGSVLALANIVAREQAVLFWLYLRAQVADE